MNLLTKSLTICTALSLTCTSLLAQVFNATPVNEGSMYEALGMSANHRYVVGLNVATYKAFVWDTDDNSFLQNEGDYANTDFRHVTDDGRAFGILGEDDMVTTNAAYFDTDGKVHLLDKDMSACYDVTPDGSIAVGCLLDELWTPTACIWVDGKRVMLPCPTNRQTSIVNYGANAMFISGDGSVIAGYLQDNLSSRPMIIWRRAEDGTYKFDVVSEKYWEETDGEGKPFRKFECLGLSQNGEWACLAVQHEGNEGMTTPESLARLNLVTGVLEEAKYPSDKFSETDSSFPSGVANNGTVIGSLLHDEMGYKGIVWKSGDENAEYISDVFPQFDKLKEYENFIHMAVAISPDAKYIAGFGCSADYEFQSYMINARTPLDIDHVFENSDIQPKRRYNLYGQPVGAGAKGLIIEGNKLIIK